MYNSRLREKAITLRKEGFSVREISRLLSISQSTSSIWLSHIKLGKTAQILIQEKKINSRKKALEVLKNKRDMINQNMIAKVQKELESLPKNVTQHKLLCAFLFWAEGSKNLTSLGFVNSDPHMIKTFLTLLRNSFTLDERKFRVLMHLHEYHDEKQLKDFWSSITQIPLEQFNKTYWKPHTGRNIKEGYRGTVSIRYYSAQIAQELTTIYNTANHLISKSVGV